MARKKKMDYQRDDEPGLNISPLIDVAFLLIIYFLVTSSLQPSEADLGIRMPSMSQSSDPPEIEPLKISIDEQENITVGGEIVDTDASNRKVPGLVGKINDYRSLLSSLGAEALVVVAANDDSKHQRFSDVLNALAEADIKTISLTGFSEK